jgi:hypothetical protein
MVACTASGYSYRFFKQPRIQIGGHFHVRLIPSAALFDFS